MPVSTPSSPRKLNGSTPPWRPVRVKELPRRTGFSFDSLEDALSAFAHGEPIVVMDDESRENEGDIIMSASKCTTEAMAWIIKHTRSACPGTSIYLLTRFRQWIRLHRRTTETPSRASYSDDGSK